MSASTVEEALKQVESLQLAVDATLSSIQPWLEKAKNGDEALEMSSGLSLLLVRPQVLLASVHHLVLMTALRLSGVEHEPKPAQVTFGGEAGSMETAEDAIDTLAGDLVVNNEIIDKVRGMEGKLSYQIKKLSALAEAAEVNRDEVENVEEDPLSFRPNISAMTGTGPSKSKASTRNDEESGEGVYRPPRVAAMPYNGPGQKTRKDRRAPALLSEFADTLGGTPLLESTSGLSTRPVNLGRHTNSLSEKRAKELKEMNEYEETNMTRLGMTKKEAKRRREDEEALALGYGISEKPKGRRGRVNGLEGELEGVLGSRGSKGVWEGVSGLGGRGGVLERGKRIDRDEGGSAPRKKSRFAKALKGSKRR